MNLRSKRGFSLVEALMTITLLGILTAVAFPRIQGVLEVGNDKQAAAKAQVLNSAKLSFKMRLANAEQRYANAGSEENKYALLKNYIPLSDSSLQEFTPKNYSFRLGNQINDKVVLKRGSKALPY